MDNLKINIFTPENSWMRQYSQKLYSFLSDNNYHVSIANELTDETGDIAFYLSYPKILSSSQLKNFKNNIIVHYSNIPQGKGWSPASWQILEGKKNITLSLFEAAEKVDSGKIYLQDSITLNGTELIHEWQTLFGQKTVELCITFIENYPKIIQEGKLPEGTESFYPKRTPKDSELNIHKSIYEQFNLLRIVDNENYPAFFYLNGEKYILKIYKEQSK